MVDDRVNLNSEVDEPFWTTRKFDRVYLKKLILNLLKQRLLKKTNEFWRHFLECEMIN